MNRSLSAPARSLTLLGLTALMLLTGCSAPTTHTDASAPNAEASNQAVWPRTIEIPAGAHTTADTLTLNSEPQRIVTLDYESTEVVAALGAAGRLVLIPEAVLNPVLGGHVDELADVAQTFPVALEVDPETIISNAPDLVIFSPRHGNEAPIAETLAQAGIATLQLPESWSSSRSLLTNVALIGESTGLEQPASALVETLSLGYENGEIYADELASDGSTQPRVLLLTNQAGRPFITAGEALPVELLEIAGGASVATELGFERTGPISAEHVIQANPDGVVLIDMNGTGDRMFADFLANPAVASLPAFAEDRILRIDGRQVQALGLTDTLTGLESLTDWVHALPTQ